MPHTAQFKPCETHVIIVNDEDLGKSGCKFDFSRQVKKTFEAFFDLNNNQCKICTKENEAHIVSNFFKESWFSLRIALLLQVVEMSLFFAKDNPGLTLSKIEDYQQPLLLGSTKIQEKHVSAAIQLIEIHQTQRKIISSDDEITEDFNMLLQENIGKDVLLLKGGSNQ